MMRIGVAGCEHIRGSTLHALGMRILSRQNVLQATGRVARPLNQFEMQPLLYDLSADFGIKAYEAAWARASSMRSRDSRRTQQIDSSKMPLSVG
jgi:DNA helicase-2/ATP-dependent DNA helicase PcrA